MADNTNPKPEAPANPELSNVAVNRASSNTPAPAPAAPAAAPAPAKAAAPAPAKVKVPTATAGAPATQIGKEADKKGKNRHFLLGCMGGFIFLFVVFIVLMVLVMSNGGENNPVLKAFGVDPAGIKQFLLSVISISFGTLSFFLFMMMVIGIFRLLSAKKTDPDARSRGLRMTLFSLIPFILILFIWLFLYGFIQKIELSSEKVVAEIVVTSPKDLTDLQAPVEITFSSANVIKALQRQKFPLTSLHWDFEGNGEYATSGDTSPEMVHLYNNRGRFAVGLKAEGDKVDPIFYTLPVDIKDAVFGADPATGTAPLTVQFDAGKLVPKGFKLQSLDWDFDGDGKYDIQGPDNLKPRFTFEKIGTFTTHLRIIDQSNNVQNYTRDINIVASDVPLLTAQIDATPSLSGPIPLQVHFDGSNSSSVKGKIINYEWDFGDGSDVQSGRSVSHIFQKPGFYTVGLRVVDDGGKENKTTAQVEAKDVNAVPVAAMTTVPAADKDHLSGDLPLKVDFDASPSTDANNDIVDYEWDFNGDGTLDQTGKKATYTFDKAGDYTVTLTVRDSQKQENKATLKVTVAEPGVKALISAAPEEGTAPLIVQFDGSGSTAFESSIVSYEWDFGDGSPKTITGASISHKYSAVGSYTVKLKVVTNKSQSAESTKIVYVREIPLRACFTPSRTTGPAPISVTFDSKCSSGGISKFTWDFGDGSTSTDRKPSHTFDTAGNYTVTLEVADDKNNVSTYSDVIVAQGQVTP